MDITVNGVRVTNWSKEPLLTLNSSQRQKLDLAIRYSRQISEDAYSMVSDYLRKRQVKVVDRQMAHDLFGNQKDVREALFRYFGLDMSAPGAMQKLTKIRDIFAKVRQGLNGPFEIVVGHVHDLDDVKEGLSDAMDSLKKGSVTGAIRDIQHIRKGTGGWIRGAGTANTGRIHLNVERLDSLKAGKVARIIVHEASHKFANTDDVTTTDVNGVEWVGYKWDGLRQDKANAAPHQNLENNADSYAWGGRLMWKRKRHHPNGI
jgi:hypothetical protein